MVCEFKRDGELTTRSEHRCCLMDTTTGRAVDLPDVIAHDPR